jgi:hypothetical protein
MRSHYPCRSLMFALALTLILVAGCNVNTEPPVVKASSDTPLQAPPFSEKAAQESAIVVPAGQVLYVRLQQDISSVTAETGQSFSAVLDQPLVIDGRGVAPAGAPVNGRVLAARHSGHLHDSGYLRLALSSISIQGREVPLQTRSIFIHGGSYKNRNLAYIGGGAGGGALIGALAGGGKGALIGSLIGAGGGTTAAYATGKKDVGFAAEHRLAFRLAQDVTIAPAAKLK